MNNVMVDLETPDNSVTSGIISIGAVKFDGDGINREDTFYRVIDLQSCIDNGLTVSGSTIAWWMKQSDEARKVFNEPSVHIAIALQDFAKWLPEDCKMWGNGAAFDNAILSHAYKKCFQPQPWAFWDDRCYRTVAAATDVRRVQQGVHHNALDDAISQAEHLIQIASHIL